MKENAPVPWERQKLNTQCCVEENGSSGEQLTKQNGLNDGNKQKTNGINIIP